MDQQEMDVHPILSGMYGNPAESVSPAMDAVPSAAE